MRRQLTPAIRIFAVLTIVLGLAYPLVATGIAQVVFPAKANGSLVKDASGRVVGSRLIGQGFTGAIFFDDLAAQRHTFVADVDFRASNELAHIACFFATKRAADLAF